MWLSYSLPKRGFSCSLTGHMTSPPAPPTNTILLTIEFIIVIAIGACSPNSFELMSIWYPVLGVTSNHIPLKHRCASKKSTRIRLLITHYKVQAYAKWNNLIQTGINYRGEGGIREKQADAGMRGIWYHKAVDKNLVPDLNENPHHEASSPSNSCVNDARACSISAESWVLWEHMSLAPIIQFHMSTRLNPSHLLQIFDNLSLLMPDMEWVVS